MRRLERAGIPQSEDPPIADGPADEDVEYDTEEDSSEDNEGACPECTRDINFEMICKKAFGELGSHAHMRNGRERDIPLCGTSPSHTSRSHAETHEEPQSKERTLKNSNHAWNAYVLIMSKKES